MCDFKKKWKSLNEAVLSLKSQFKSRKTLTSSTKQRKKMKNTPFPKVVKHDRSILLPLLTLVVKTFLYSSHLKAMFTAYHSNLAK